MAFEQMQSSSTLFVEEKRLSVHVQILSGVYSHGDELISEENCRGVHVLAQAITNSRSKLLQHHILA